MKEREVPAPEGLQDEFIIDDLETLKVLADPLRKQIMELLDRPNTVKQIAKRLGTSPSKLYYHVNLLEEHGLIRVTDTRIVSGIIEKHYQMTARTIRIKSGLLSPATPAGDESLNLLLTKIFDETKDDVIRAARSGVIDLGGDATKDRKMLLLHATIALAPEQARAFYDRLERLIDEFNACEAGDDDLASQEHTLQIAYFPHPADESTPDPDED